MSDLEKLWVLIMAGVDRKVDVMATDEHYKPALDLVRKIMQYGTSYGDISQTTIKLFAAALVDMEYDLAQARGLLVSMTRGATKWRDIARGESIDVSTILTRDQVGLLLGMLVTYGADADVDPEIKAIHRVIHTASAKFVKAHK